ncbi:hypothetical protein BIU92_05515 [Curtobacterium sp. MCBA15_003]|nr:hypothetical protein BIU92_05515 [Curtobacterium sp. MCBA15_003]OII31999.1 hypothetical protein BIU94_01060 [Curtobacterium sp. MMLR14_006]
MPQIGAVDMSTSTLVRQSRRSPFSEVREARRQRTLQLSALVSGIAGVTATALALITIGLGS